MKPSKNILLVAYNFPPLLSPQSIRWFYLAREISQAGYHLDVVTIRMPPLFRHLLDEMPSTISVHRTFPGPFYYITHKYSKEPSGPVPAGVPARPSSLWRTLTKVHLSLYKLLNAMLFPDIYAEWFPFALSAVHRLLSECAYDVVISSSEPRMCHFIGWAVKSRSKALWIADYGDPWVYPLPTLKEPKWKKRLLERAEARLLRRMDCITVAAEGIKSLYHQRYPDVPHDRIVVMPQGFDPTICTKVRPEVPSKFRIVYCGSLYRNLRDPTALFEAVSHLKERDIEIVIAGRINEFAEVLESGSLVGRVRYEGVLGHKETLSLEKGASVLLHIGNATDVQVPGKIYEYLGVRRPILCIRGCPGDASAELILRYNRGVVVENREPSITEAIRMLFGLWQQQCLEEHFDLRDLPDFSWQKSAERLLSIIELT